MSSNDARPHITVQPNGPYLVSGPAILTRRAIVRSERGEPMTWQTTSHVETAETFALCRCGGSNAKPFCDGTHRRNDFDGTESAPTNTYAERAKSYEATGVVMRDDRAICEHAGFCGNQATNAWRLAQGDTTKDPVARMQLMHMIEHCPSGALTFRLEPEGEDVEPALPVGIAVTRDGPYFVTGGIRIERSDGQSFETRNRVTLCRCGNSKSKPLCDGSHLQVGFQDG